MLFVIAPATQAGAWGEEGHRGIAEAVRVHLKTLTTKAIAQIADTGDALPLGTLARLSEWPDQIRALAKNPHATISRCSPLKLEEARQCVAAYSDHTNRHFVDLPPGSARYPELAHPNHGDPALPFTNTADTIHMIHRSVDIMPGHGGSAHGETTTYRRERWQLKHHPIEPAGSSLQ